MTNDESDSFNPQSGFGIRVSSLFRHSSFVIRHSSFELRHYWQVPRRLRGSA
jgi:hypothetical protein